MSKKAHNPPTPYEEAIRNINRIISELDKELARINNKEGK